MNSNFEYKEYNLSNLKREEQTGIITSIRILCDDDFKTLDIFNLLMKYEKLREVKDTKFYVYEEKTDKDTIKSQNFETLADFIQRNKRNNTPLDEASVILKIGIQLISGLNSLHIKNIVHGDLRPGNILISKDGKYNIKIIGFTSNCCNFFRKSF